MTRRLQWRPVMSMLLWKGNFRQVLVAADLLGCVCDSESDTTVPPEGHLTEHEWTRFKDIEFQDVLRKRHAATERSSHFQCTACPNFSTHVHATTACVFCRLR